MCMPTFKHECKFPISLRGGTTIYKYQGDYYIYKIPRGLQYKIPRGLPYNKYHGDYIINTRGLPIKNITILFTTGS